MTDERIDEYKDNLDNFRYNLHDAHCIGLELIHELRATRRAFKNFIREFDYVGNWEVTYNGLMQTAREEKP